MGNQTHLKELPYAIKTPVDLHPFFWQWSIAACPSTDLPARGIFGCT